MKDTADTAGGVVVIGLVPHTLALSCTTQNCPSCWKTNEVGAPICGLSVLASTPLVTAHPSAQFNWSTV